MKTAHSGSDPLWDIWRALLSEQDRAVITLAGYDAKGSALWNSRGLGRRPALLVIDMQELLVGPNLPILDAVQTYRTAMGAVAWAAVEHIAPFIESLRDYAVPIVYTRVIPPGRSEKDPDVQIINRLAPRPGDGVIDKRFTSAFFGTGLLSMLERASVDTLIIVGNSTSGCVRAAVVDARQHGFNPVVPVECVFDRIEASHKIGLLDMWMKYAAVMPAAQVLAYVDQVMGQPHGD